jgi:hypothetical protein
MPGKYLPNSMVFHCQRSSFTFPVMLTDFLCVNILMKIYSKIVTQISASISGKAQELYKKKYLFFLL